MFVLIAMMIGAAGGVAGIYTTPEQIHSYAEAVTGGLDALVAINGRVEGIDSLGGIIQDEFGFLAAFLLPFLGISLIAQTTRHEEESGRLETVLAGQVARHVPALAGLRPASAAIFVTAVAFALGLVAFGVPATGTILYAASLGALAFVFAGLAAVLAQVALHSRGIYMWVVAVFAGAYVLRGVGDVTDTWITWLSPLGWAEKAAPFGPMRWWTLLIPLVIGGLLASTAIVVAGRRDLGSSLVRGGGGSGAGHDVAAQPARVGGPHPPSGGPRLAGRCRDPRRHDGRPAKQLHSTPSPATRPWPRPSGCQAHNPRMGSLP